jgi:hypothetical protein
LGRAFFVPDPDLELLADLADVRDFFVTDLAAFRGSAFPPFWLAFFAFGLALPAMVTSWGREREMRARLALRARSRAHALNVTVA